MSAPAPDCLLLFPHQLYREHPALRAGRPVALLEEPLYFTQFRFHQQKLVLHRASMRAYQHMLHAQGLACDYVEAGQPTADVRQWVTQTAAGGLRQLHAIDPVDDWLRRRLEKAAAAAGLALTMHPSPNFLNEMGAANAFFDGRKRYFQTDFYVAQRSTAACCSSPTASPAAAGGASTPTTAPGFRRTKPCPPCPGLNLRPR